MTGSLAASAGVVISKHSDFKTLWGNIEYECFRLARVRVRLGLGLGLGFNNSECFEIGVF